MKAATFFTLFCVLVTQSCTPDKLVAPRSATLGLPKEARDVLSALGQEGREFKWLSQFGSAAHDFGWNLHTDGNGNIYMAGDAGGELPGQTSSGGLLDAFVRKYDAEGHEVWTRQFGTAATDRAFGIFNFGADVYLTGSTRGAFAGHVNAGQSDAFLRKYDANGNEQWTRQFGTPGVDELIGIFADVTGVYVSGNVDGALPGQTYAAAADVFLRKYDVNGNELWTRQFGSLLRDLAFKVYGDNSGIYMVGVIAGALPGQTPRGGADAFVRKYDFNGTELWTRQFGTSGIDLGLGVVVEATSVYVVGRTDGALPGHSNAGGPDAFVRKYDSGGNELWTRQFGTSFFEVARGVSVRDQVVYVSGPTRGALTCQPNAGGDDVFVRAYTAEGRELWTRQFGSQLDDDNWGISAASSGLYLVGSAGGSLPRLSSHGGIDAFIGNLLPGRRACARPS